MNRLSVESLNSPSVTSGGGGGILGKNKWKYPVILDVVEVVGLSPQ